MRAKQAGRRYGGSGVISLCLSLSMGVAGCANGGGTVAGPLPEVVTAAGVGRDVAARIHFTGDVDVVWSGGQGMGAPESGDRISHAAMALFPGVPPGSPGPGWFTFSVVNLDGTVHRQIEAAVTWAGLENQVENPGEIRFVGVVVSDTKPCGGSGHRSEGGCEDEGGCSGFHEEGSCSGGHEGGEAGGMARGGVNGSDCRIGQVVLGWAMDGGTPAVGHDRVSWKFFAPDAPKALMIQAAIDAGTEIPWPCKLCEKEILGGNVRLFLR